MNHAGSSAVEANPMNAANGLSICIIEDDPHFRETFSDAMSLWDVKVRGAGTAQAGLEILKFHKPSVIVLDIKLPDSNGLDLCRRIRNMPELRSVPILLVSASSRYNGADGLLAGASAFLPKPISIEELWTEICAVLKRPAPELA
jgi:DNA-binding response OmpR family regulator